MRGFRAVRKGSRARSLGDEQGAAVTRGLDPRVHLLRMDFANVMDARVKPAHSPMLTHTQPT